MTNGADHHGGGAAKPQPETKSEAKAKASGKSPPDQSKLPKRPQ